MTASFEDLIKLNIRVGEIQTAIFSPEAKVPAYQIVVDFGNAGIRQTSAQLTQRYEIKDLIGKKVIAALGLPPKRVAGFKSECLILGAIDGEGDVILLNPEDAPLGWQIL